jgi:1,4-alpha-glucan branching enzyme
VEFFYFHPDLDQNQGVRVFAFCRTGGLPLGSKGQVVAVVNAGLQNFTEYRLPWAWGVTELVREHGAPGDATPPQFSPRSGEAVVSLAPFQVRVFST